MLTSSDRSHTLANYFARIMNDLRHRYANEFDPPVRDDATHALEIRVNSEYSVHCPQNYRISAQ